MNLTTIFRDRQLSSDVYSNWIDCRNSASINIHISWDYTGAAVGAFKVHFSNDPTAKQEADLHSSTPGIGAAQYVDVTTAVSAGSVAGTGLDSDGSGGNTFINVDNPPAFVRIAFIHSTGGGGSSLNGWASFNGSRP